ncbi:MAG: hypothetical protein R3E50_12990 [Halioglobus sp.]
MPVIWLIDAYRAGERGQVRALVDALGWPSETKVLAYRHHVFLPHVLSQATLRGITPASAAQLRPPWPDLVISSGVRNEPVCRWFAPSPAAAPATCTWDGPGLRSTPLTWSSPPRSTVCRRVPMCSTTC